jgi:hypothetical protein
MIKFLKFTVSLSILLASSCFTSKAATANMPTSLPVQKSMVGTRDIMQEIINVIGLKPRFELMAAEIDNAAAVVYNGKRYILYNQRFLSAINNAAHTDWGGVSIIAHEIGHHLNGHTLSSSGSNPSDELEADEFSGFVLRKMGASLADAQAAIKLISDNRSTRTHPGRNSRLEAISKGWRSANEQLIASARLPQPDQRTVNTSPGSQNKFYQSDNHRKRPVFDSRLVLNRVHFDESPQEEYYITTKLLLVHISDHGIRILGKLAHTNNPDYPYYLKSDQIKPLFVTERGVLVNSRGQQVGYLT